MNKTIEYNRAWLEKVFPGVSLESIVELVVEHKPPVRTFSYDTNQYVDECRARVIMKTQYGGTIETTVTIQNGEVKVAEDYSCYNHHLELPLPHWATFMGSTVATTRIPEASATAMAQKKIAEQQLLDAGEMLGKLKATQQWIEEDNERLRRTLEKKNSKPKQVPKVDPYTPGGRKLNLPKPTEN